MSIFERVAGHRHGKFGAYIRHWRDRGNEAAVAASSWRRPTEFNTTLKRLISRKKTEHVSENSGLLLRIIRLVLGQGEIIHFLGQGQCEYYF